MNCELCCVSCCFSRNAWTCVRFTVLPFWFCGSWSASLGDFYRLSINFLMF
uniref:Uncharacterized protein n=1 Tax=Setaria italica TaxID=4555 RepID=K4A4B1_SETIT